MTEPQQSQESNCGSQFSIDGTEVTCTEHEVVQVHKGRILNDEGETVAVHRWQG
jgi:hypothetical protein